MIDSRITRIATTPEAHGVSPLRVPFNRPFITGRELEYVADAMQRRHLAGDGWYTRQCSELLSEILGGARVLLTTSGTHALEMAALLLNLQPGDEVILPAFTFVSSANAFVLRGVRPVFADIRSDTFNLDERDVERRITSRTRAIVAVHYGGVACEMDVLQKLSERYGVPIVEDAAHALFGSYRGRPLGAVAPLAALSFHETKNVTCGEGGALVINDPSLIGSAEIIREKGTDRSRFLRGEVAKYNWIDIGSSYLPSELVAAFLYGQLEVREFTQSRRRHLWERYERELKPWAAQKGVRLPVTPSHCEQPYHLFALLLESPSDRERLREHLRAREIEATFHYLPLHLSPVGHRFGGREGDCPVTEMVSERLLRLPLFTDMTEAEQSRTIDAILEF
ncbi:MAG: dTDP-4-amino-4,6-dideoxygalactose transaminase [Thermoanaerobaculia bacterium]